MGKSQRVKGHTFEREIVRWFKTNGIPAERILTETRDGNRGDVRAGPLKYNLLNPATDSLEIIETAWKMRIQAKHRAMPSVWKAMDEARASRTSLFEITPAIVKRTYDQTVVCLTPDEFMFLVLASIGRDPLPITHLGDRP